MSLFKQFETIEYFTTNIENGLDLPRDQVGSCITQLPGYSFVWLHFSKANKNNKNTMKSSGS